jgi:hypothetical protein
MWWKVAATCCITFAIVGFGLAATPTRDDVVGLENKTWQLWQQHDKPGFASLMDSDFVAVDTHGIASKAENIADIDNLNKEAYDLSNFRVHRIGPDTMFLTYHARLKGTYKGKRIDGTYYVSSVWAKRQGKWLNVLYHETRAE